jgi:hypothetical protein
MTVDFRCEALICYYADICRQNFPVDRRWQRWAVNFRNTGVLPASFMSFILDVTFKDPLPIPIRKTIPLGTSINVKPMIRAYEAIQAAVRNFCKFYSNSRDHLEYH